MKVNATACDRLQQCAPRADVTRCRLQHAQTSESVACSDCRSPHATRIVVHTFHTGLTHMAGNIATNGGAPVARNAEPTNGARILRLPQVCSVTGFGRSMIYQMESEGRFPQRVHIGIRAVGWIESEIQEWLRIRIESGRARRT